MIQNLWDAPKAVLRGIFTALQSQLKKQDKNQTNNLNFYLKQHDKEQKNLKLVEGRTSQKSEQS